MEPTLYINWTNRLKGSSLYKSQQRSYAITIRWYLGHCSHKRSSVNVASAHQFIESVAEERQPEEWMLQQWKDAINWFFRHGMTVSGKYIVDTRVT